MSDSNKLGKKSSSLKSAIERYKCLTKFVDVYKATKSLDEYIDHLRSGFCGLSDDTIAHYESMFIKYSNGDDGPLLFDLYNKLLSADEYKNKLCTELKTLLREQWEYNFRTLV